MSPYGIGMFPPFPGTQPAGPLMRNDLADSDEILDNNILNASAMMLEDFVNKINNTDTYSNTEAQKWQTRPTSTTCPIDWTKNLCIKSESH